MSIEVKTIDTTFDKLTDDFSKISETTYSQFGSFKYFNELKYQYLIDYFNKKKIDIDNRLLLDFGCGSGHGLEYWQKYFKKVVGVDTSINMLKYAVKNAPNCLKIQAPPYKLPIKDNSFDIISAICVFHHIPKINFKSLLNELYSKLKSTGWLFIFEHNPLNPYTYYNVTHSPIDRDAEMIRASELKKNLTATDFKFEKIEYIVFYPEFLKSLKATEKFLRWCPLGGQYVLIARKND